jgi:hypothetical protein
MSQPLQSINLVAPAFKGINTEDSPIAQDPSFAEVADNAVIDKRGRIAARKGHVLITETNGTTLRQIKEFKDNAGNTEIFSVGDNTIFKGTTTLTAQTIPSYTITADNWKIVNFNDNLYFFQVGHEPLVYNDTDGIKKMSAVTGASLIADIPKANEVIGAYGRLWCADTGTDKSTVYWSDLLIGQNWTGGTSGSIDISKVWPDGYDEIVSLAAHNGFLIIFGRHSIVVYQGAEAPATMSLADTVAGVGCVDRDTVQHTGTDVLFLSHTGLRSFGRTIQQKSMPISTLSKTITRDITALLQSETSYYRSVYSPEENFYLLTFVGQQTTYCFDLRGQLEDGSFRVTLWPGSVFTCYERLESGDLYVGTSLGISSYGGYSDNGDAYRFRYYSPSLTFGDISKLKILKKIKPTLVGANSSTVFMKFAYDFDTTYRTTEFTVGNQTPAYFGVNEFHGDDPGDESNPLSEFTGGALTTQRSLNAVGNGSTVVIGLEADISGSPLSLQEINVQALIGKTV